MSFWDSIKPHKKIPVAVNVTLSATDPAEAGGGAPKTVDVSAAPSSWSPNALQAAVGDTVRWNFPSTAQVPHDLWLIKPGEAPELVVG